MAPKEGFGESGDDKSIDETGYCHPGYLISFPGLLRVVNIILGAIIIGFWIPGYEHDYTNPAQIVNFRDLTKHYGAGYKTDTLNQFALADVILCLMFSLALLVAIVVMPHSYVDWNRMNKIAHGCLAIFHGIGTICAMAGVWNFQENCCRVDLEWNGIGFQYKPAVHEFGYQRNNMHCNCWLTRRESNMDTGRKYSVALWEPQHYPDNYADEESTFVSFAAHHIHLHVVALMLMIANTLVYTLAAIFSKPKSSTKTSE